MHRRMLEVAEGLTPDESRVIVSFLRKMTEALDEHTASH
jgi:hypothetical protein